MRVYLKFSENGVTTKFIISKPHFEKMVLFVFGWIGYDKIATLMGP